MIVADDGKARLGTQALTLALEDELAQSASQQGQPSQPDDRRAYRDGLARTLVAAMRDDGTLPAYLATSPGGQADGDSQFFPGEAVLALVRHFKATGERPLARRRDEGVRRADPRVAGASAGRRAAARRLVGPRRSASWTLSRTSRPTRPSSRRGAASRSTSRQP